ncbi:hypothetical protein OG500_14205 [Kitasatospora sp. NBC_01250]|uniref:hypothetical protein n=1 Tax=unclassified Kitasatospora TaxID=2633591 RepID=UPI002E16452A|nr:MULTISPECIES: hypothetical protein [unclassified Kitasatospora]WSJ67398.1 hypothetical protein OG294_15470 [Kitasatospora sp. NBC_01302]
MTDHQDAPPPAYPPAGAGRRADRRTPARRPRLRPPAGRAASRAGRSGGADRPALLAARSVLALAVLVGQLWALTVATNAWMVGDTDTAWWTTAFSIGSFLAVLLLWWRAPRGDR